MVDFSIKLFFCKSFTNVYLRVYFITQLRALLGFFSAEDAIVNEARKGYI